MKIFDLLCNYYSKKTNFCDPNICYYLSIIVISICVLVVVVFLIVLIYQYCKNNNKNKVEKELKSIIECYQESFDKIMSDNSDLNYDGIDKKIVIKKENGKISDVSINHKTKDSKNNKSSK